MEEVLTSTIKFWMMSVKSVIYQMETESFSSVSTTFSRGILTWSISNSNNHIKEEKMLCLVVEHQNFVINKK